MEAVGRKAAVGEDSRGSVPQAAVATTTAAAQNWTARCKPRETGGCELCVFGERSCIGLLSPTVYIQHGCGSLSTEEFVSICSDDGQNDNP